MRAPVNAALYDVAIVGAGVAGALIAHKLATAGRRVLLLEAGPDDRDRTARVQQYATAFAKIPASPYIDAEIEAKVPIPKVIGDTYYQQPGSTRFKSTYQRRVGGSTWHWLGNTPRFLPNDFILYSLYGRGLDWPIGYHDLEPWYCEAEHALGVSGDHDVWDGVLGANRSRPFPMPKIWEAYGDAVVARALDGAAFEGVPIQLRPTPQARNSQPYQGRPPCAGNSSCVPICPIQAKYDATVHVDLAAEAGAEVRPQAVVHGLATDGTKITELTYRDWSGADHTVAAKQFVLAAHAVETAKILLISGLRTSSNQIGRNLMDHPQGYGGGLLAEPVYPFRGPPTTSGVDDFRDGQFRERHGAFRMSIGNDGLGRIEPITETLRRLLAENTFGPGLRSALEERITRVVRISYSTEMLPRSDNRVVLSGERDGLGIPKPELHFRLDDYSFAAFDTARRLLRYMFEYMGATEFRYKSDDPSEFSGAGHVMGTTRMGTLKRDSVVNADCVSHDYDNLSIAGASVFPTCGTANPTLTVAALALRLASHLERRL